MGERITPEQARAKLDSLQIDEESYGAIMTTRHSQPMATSHELKALVTIATGDKSQDFDKVYSQMRKRFPQS